jgi:hypothetical protein
MVTRLETKLIVTPAVRARVPALGAARQFGRIDRSQAHRLPTASNVVTIVKIRGATGEESRLG